MCSGCCDAAGASAGGGGLHYLAGFGQEFSAGRGKVRWTLHVACCVCGGLSSGRCTGISAVKSHTHKAFTIRTDLYATAAVQT